MVKTIRAESVIDIPKDAKLFIKSRRVTVKGPRGILRRDFRHLSIDFQIINGGKQLKAEMWFGDRRKLATLRTATSHIKNLITGVTKGFLLKMRMVYAHFPISISVDKNGSEVAIRNFLGEKEVRQVRMFEGVSCARSTDGTKDEIIVTGNDLDKVSQSAANIHIATRVRNKDIRKFLDGVYVSHKGLAKIDD